MTERPNPTPLPAEGANSWDAAAIADTLDARAEPHLDPLHGRGSRLQIGLPADLNLELFPTSQIVRLRTPKLSLSLVQEQEPRFAPRGVIFEAPQRVLSISSAGDVLLRLDRPPVRETPSEPLDSAEESMTREREEAGLLDDSTAPDGPFQSPMTERQMKEHATRIQLAGRLGTNVRFRTTAKGTTIASFALAIREDDGSTRWQDVLMFAERAENLRAGEAPTKGQYCEVVGYPHQREVKGKDGTIRIVEEIYAVVVKPR